MHAPRTLLILLFLPIAFGVVAKEALATSYVWVNPGSGRWDQTGNWNYSGYPRYAWDFAIFNQDALYDVDASSTSLQGVGGILVAAGTVGLTTHDGFTGVLAVGTVGLPARLDLEGTFDGAGTQNVGATGVLSLHPGSRWVSRSTEPIGFDILSGGLLCGDQAAIDGHLLRNLGTVSPGLAPGAPGLLLLGQVSPASYRQRETGLLEIDIAGTDPGTGYDQLRVVNSSAPIQLDGSLTVAFAPGFVPAPGMRFDFLTAPEVTGTFSTVLLPEAPPGLEVSLVYEPDRVSLLVEGTVVPVSAGYRLDVQPGSCENPVSANKRGVIPVAVLGEPELDVHEIDLASLRLLGVAPEWVKFADVASPPAEETEGCTCGGDADGIDDVLLKFPAQELLAQLPSGDGTRQVTLTGTLLDGTPFEASDCVTLVGGEPSPNARKFRIAPSSSPTQPLQTVSYQLPEAGPVRLSVISVTGRLVTELVTADESAGTHLVNWNAEGQANGVYFYRLETRTGITTSKFLLAR